jgi:hypothetical protein
VISALLLEMNGICFAQGEDLYKDPKPASTNVLNAQFSRITSDLRKSEGSVFQVQNMLNNRCILISSKTNRFLGINPGTGDPPSADRPGTLPGRKDGTVLTWKVIGSE